MKKQIKLIIFDLDGVLCDTPDLHFETFMTAYHEYTGVIITKKEHDIDFNGLSTRKKLEILKKRDNLEDSICDQIWAKKQEYTFKYVDDWVKRDEQKIEMMKSLKEDGFMLACASNAIRKTVELILKNMDLFDLFDIVLSNEDVKYVKPAAEIYLKAMIELNCNPNNTLIIEDSQLGYNGALTTKAEVLRVVDSKDVTLQRIKNRLSQIQDNTMKEKYQNKNLTVVIPMAGAGSRFEQAGYTFPKPLIDVNGKPMIQTVIDSLNVDAKFVFIVREEHYEKYAMKDFLERLVDNPTVVVTDGLTEGAACTVLLAEQYIDNENPIIIANSDQYIEWDNFNFMKTNSNNNLDASILTFEATHPKWSFARLDDEGLVVEVAEKRPISNIATVGVYWWRSGSDFVKYAKQMISKDIRVNNEFYVCPVFNEAILDQKRIGIFHVDKMFGLGTPEDLEYFLNHKDSQ